MNELFDNRNELCDQKLNHDVEETHMIRNWISTLNLIGLNKEKDKTFIKVEGKRI